MADVMRNPFDDLLPLFTSDRLLRHPQATGKGVSLCLIDSGADRTILQQRALARGHSAPIIEGGIFTTGRSAPLPYEGKQSTPHGTTVSDILLTIAPEVSLFSADVFGPEGSSEVETIVEAIYWAMDVWKCKIINLSLGVPAARLQQWPRRQQLLRAIEDAYYKDVLIFAAAHNDHPLTRSYPASFTPSLVSVDKHLFANPLQFTYQLRDQIEFQAHGRGYVGPFSYELATSWAAPHLAGIAARITSLRPQLKPFELKAILYWIAEGENEKPPASGEEARG